MKKQLLSFHGKPEIKEKYLNRLKAHYAADEIIQGTGWEKGKGCAVGCTLNAYEHELFETELGIPEPIAYLEDAIFEGIPNAEAKEFPIQLLSAIPVGVDLMPVYRKFMAWLLIDQTDGVIRFAENDTQRKAITDIANLHLKAITSIVTNEEWAAARAAAWAAARAAAWAAAWAAARAAARAAAYQKMRDKLLQLLSEAK